MDPININNFYDDEESPLTFHMRRRLNAERAMRRRIIVDDYLIEATPVRPVRDQCIEQGPEPKTPVYKHTRAYYGLL